MWTHCSPIRIRNVLLNNKNDSRQFNGKVFHTSSQWRYSSTAVTLTILGGGGGLQPQKPRSAHVETNLIHTVVKRIHIAHMHKNRQLT